MDAVNLQGVWPTFPGNAVRAAYVFALYNRLLEQAVIEKRQGKRKETPRERHRRILDEVIARVTQEEEDDAFVILAL